MTLANFLDLKIARFWRSKTDPGGLPKQPRFRDFGGGGQKSSDLSETGPKSADFGGGSKKLDFEPSGAENPRF